MAVKILFCSSGLRHRVFWYMATSMSKEYSVLDSRKEYEEEEDKEMVKKGKEEEFFVFLLCSPYSHLFSPFSLSSTIFFCSM
jgi:hypothetical protein